MMVSGARNLEITEAGRIVARKLLEVYEREGGEVTPWSVRWLREQVMKLSMDLDRETIEEARQSHYSGAKPTASLFLVGVAEALDSYYEPAQDEG